MPRALLTRALLLLAVTAALALAGAAPAFAGTFDVRSCSASPGATPPTRLTGADDAWTFETDDPAHLESVRNCPSANDMGNDGLVVQDKLMTSDTPVVRYAQWRFDAPAGTSLTRLRLWRYGGKQVNTWELYTRTADGAKLTGSDCAKPPDQFFCIVGGAGVNANWTVNTSSLQVGIACSNAGSCAPGATLHEVWTGIHSAIVTINDTTAPTASGASGSLLAGGYLRGSVTTGVSSASDSTGIKRLQVRVDGDRAVATGPERACDFTRRSPCADLTSPESLTFDSTSIPDGTWTARVGVLDAGDNFTAAGTQTVTVDNTAPYAPTATSPASVTVSAPSTTVSWTEPAGQVSPIDTAHITVCGPSGCQTRTQPAGGGSGTATVTLSGHGTYTARVALQDAAGNIAANQAATWAINHPASVAPASLPTPTRASPRLALARPTLGRDRRTITVRGSVAPGVSGRVTIKATARIAGRTRTITQRVTIRSRRYAARMRLPSGAWRTAKVTVRYPGSASRRAATVTRAVK